MTSLTLVRRIRARPSIVFDALTTPEGIASWWGPDSGPVLVAEVDPQVGGRFRVRFRMLDGSEHESSGEYLELVKPERLSMSWRWAGGAENPGELLLEIRLRAVAEGDRAHIDALGPARRGESPQPRGRLDRSARQAGTPFCNRTEFSVTKHPPRRAERGDSLVVGWSEAFRRASADAMKIAKEDTA